MQIALRFVVLITFALLGFFLNSLAIHTLLATDVLSSDTPDGFGTVMLEKASYVWMVSVVLGIASIFIKQKWRYLLLLSPLLAPMIFSILYVISME